MTTILDVIGVTALAIFAGFVWLPLPLLVLGLAALAASRQLSAATRRPAR